MDSQSHNSQVEQVQFLLQDLKNSLIQLAPEQKAWFSDQLGGITGWLQQQADGSGGPDNEAGQHGFDANGEVPEQNAFDMGEPWLGLALKQAKCGAWQWDVVNRVVHWSPELYELLGYEAGKIITDPQDFFEIIHPEDRVAVYEHIKESVLRGGSFTFEFRTFHTDGREMWILSTGTVEQDSAGHPIQATGISQEITARKTIEEDLRQSEAQLRKWREQINIWSQTTNSFFWILTPDGEYNNPSVVKPYFTGRTFEENRGMKWLEVFHPEDRERVREKIETALREKTPFDIEARVWRKADQEWNWYLHSAVPMVEDGTITGWIGASNNIQERKEVIQTLEATEAALRKSEAKEHARAAELQAVINAAPTPILLVRKNGDGAISGNQMAYQFFRAQPGENLANYLCGQPVSHIVYNTYNDEQVGHNEIPLLAALRTGKPVKDFEGRLTYDDGSQVALFGSATPLFNAAGETEGAVCIFMDITQKTAAEQALRESEQRFRVALASAPVTVFSTDAQQRYNWIYNPRHNLRVEDVLGKRGDQILVAEDVSEFTQVKQEVLETGKPIQREINIKINGEILNHLVSLDPIFDQSGQITGMVGSTLDITQQRRLEAEHRENAMRMLTQRRLMEYRENERMTIAREFHDGPIQTLMGMIFAMHGILLNITDPTILAELQPVQTSMKNAVHELRQVLNELRPPSLERFGLARAVQKHAETIQEKCPDLDLRLEIGCNVSDISEQASLTLYRVCQEALNNIARHSLATNASVVMTCNGEAIGLEIQDNGVGFSGKVDFIALSEHSHFGMVGMKERVEAMGGSFYVTSQKNYGTKIRVSIPKDSTAGTTHPGG